MEPRQRILLSACLGDAKRVWQRAGRPAGAEWTPEFVAGWLPEVWRPAAAAIAGQAEDAGIADLVALARQLAAGRRGETPGAVSDRPVQLPSLVARLAESATRLADGAAYYPLAALALTEAVIFPGPVMPEADQRAAYARLWEGFRRAVATIPAADFAAGFETLYYLLQKYTWAVPAEAAGAGAEESLFDRARLTAAIAAALAGTDPTPVDLAALIAGPAAAPEAWEAGRWALVGGDITGIQPFLYTLTARGAARGLRGRSFYLQLLGDVIAGWVRRRLDLPVTNLLYSGGGRFYLLAPWRDEAEWAALRRDLDQALLACHGGDLYLALAVTSLAARDFLVGPEDAAGWGPVWERLGRAMNDQKRRKFADLPPTDLYRAVFAPSGSGGATEPCAICRREAPEAPVDPETNERKCAQCRGFERLGTELRDATYLFLGQVEPVLPVASAPDYQAALRAFGVTVDLFSDPGDARRGAGLGRGTLLAIGTTELPGVGPHPSPLPAGEGASTTAVGEGASTTAVGEGASTMVVGEGAGETFDGLPATVARGFGLLANVTPRRAGEIADFADLAAASRGVRRLGILRMDVDDLGAIFAGGLGAAPGLARVAHLSFLLRLFFEGWLAELARRHNPSTTGAGGPDHVYVIYSGGDDLFIVGSWDHLVGLAREIRRDVGRFAAGNPAFHISGGIALVDEHFPLYRAADLAGDALDRAKQRRADDGRAIKDAFGFLDEVAGWDDVERAAERQAALVELVEANQGPRAVIHLLSRISQEYREARKKSVRGGRRVAPDQVPYGRWMWLASYALTRLAERLRGPARATVAELPAALLDPTAIRTLGLAARWAEISLRQEERR